MKGFLNRRIAFGGLTLLLVAASVGWTVSSAAALSHTFDEPHHLATGLEWWQFGTYSWWTENPPLRKVLVTLAPYLAGMRLPPRETRDRRGSTPKDAWSMGIELLYAQPSYEHSLMRTRLGTLPFFLLTALPCSARRGPAVGSGTSTRWGSIRTLGSARGVVSAGHIRGGLCRQRLSHLRQTRFACVFR